MIDLRLIQKPDGLYRRCIVCGHEFRIESSVQIVRVNKQGRTQEVTFGDKHPRNLMQVQCFACPPKGGAESSTPSGAGPTDPRWGLRKDGQESWRDASG